VPRRHVALGEAGVGGGRGRAACHQDAAVGQGRGRGEDPWQEHGRRRHRLGGWQWRGALRLDADHLDGARKDSGNADGAGPGSQHDSTSLVDSSGKPTQEKRSTVGSPFAPGKPSIPDDHTESLTQSDVFSPLSLDIGVPTF
jgi:hypothetical protein